MKILITGGAGYIGSHLVRALINEGHNVLIYDNLSTANKQNSIYFHPLIGDICNKIDLKRAFLSFKPDLVIHLAAFKSVRESMERPDIYAGVNICGTFNVLNAMVESDCKKILFSSSCTVVHEQASFYGYTKHVAEGAIRQYSKLRDIKHGIFRFYNVGGFGYVVEGIEEKSEMLLHNIMLTALGKKPYVDIYGTDYKTPDGTAVRDYIHIRDIVDAHLKGIEYIKENNFTISLGSGEGFSVKQIINECKNITGIDIDTKEQARRIGDFPHAIADIELAKKHLHWHPKHSNLKEIISDMWDVYKKYY